MPNQSVNYQCPSCAGTLRFDGTIGKLRCEFCESTFTAEEVEAIYAERQASSDTAAQASDARAQAGTMSAFEAAGNVGGEGTRTVAESLEDAKSVGAGQDAIHTFLERADWNDKERAGLRTYTCSSCGAALTVDAATAVTECPYCGNTAVLPGTLTDEARPQKVIPFKIDKAQATAALSQYYTGKRFLPRAFASANRIEHVQGVYVPFWLYDARVQGQAAFEATRSNSFRQGDFQVTETKVYDVRRAGTLDFSQVPADASTKMPDAHMDAIEPYDYRELKDFSVAYLPGYAAERYDVEVEAGHARAGERMRQSIASALTQSVSGYDSVSVRDVQSKVNWGPATYALLPVWLLHTSWEGNDYLFAMNGQTGRLIGDLPVDSGKVVAYFIEVFAIAAAITAAFVYMAMGHQELDGFFFGFVIGIPLIAAALAVSTSMSAMKTANEKHEASNYVGDQGLNLSVREDRYVTTRVSRTRVEQPRNSGGAAMAGGAAAGSAMRGGSRTRPSGGGGGGMKMSGGKGMSSGGAKMGGKGMR